MEPDVIDPGHADTKTAGRLQSCFVRNINKRNGLHNDVAVLETREIDSCGKRKTTRETVVFCVKIIVRGKWPLLTEAQGSEA